LQETKNVIDRINSYVALERGAKLDPKMLCKGAFKTQVLCSFSSTTTNLTTRNTDHSMLDQVIIHMQLVMKFMLNKKRNRSRNKFAPNLS